MGEHCTNTIATIATIALWACGGGSVAVYGAETSPAGLAIQGGDDGQRPEVAFAVNKVEQIYRDAGFWDLVDTRGLWLRAQDGDAGNSSTGSEIVTSDFVRRRLSALHPAEGSYVLVRAFRWYNPWRWVFAGPTTADTATCGATRILRRKIGSVDALIDTIAHENTHRVPHENDGLCKYDGSQTPEFTDTPPTADAKPWLVSYAIGDLAQCYYHYGHDPEKAMTCFENDVDDADHCRVYDECCVETDSPAVLAIRARAPWCAPYRDSAQCVRASQCKPKRW